MWNMPSKERLARIPRLYETEDIPLEHKQIHLHFFIFGSDWFIAEYNGDDLFFGYVILNNDLINAEWGFISFQDLKEININGIEVDCENEISWKIRPAIEVDKIRNANNWKGEESCTTHQ
jgi:hypothetical protein